MQGYLSNYTEEQLSQGIVEFDEENGVIYEDLYALYGADNLLYGDISGDDTQKELLLQDLVQRGEHEGYYFSK